MTSECCVYIALPGETELVTAGRFVREIDRHGVATGRFVYRAKYRARDDAVPLDPLELKLSAKTYETRFGALRDASPDHWGRRIIERHFGSPGPDELDYLLHSPDDRAGALGFGRGPEPPAPKREFNRTVELERLQAFADAIIKDEKLPDDPNAGQAQNLMEGGTSMGGARPKAVVDSNTDDDHPRNHAVIAMDTDWKLSPAYDLVPNMPISLERRDLALDCGDMGRYAHAENLLSQSARFLLEPDEAKAIINEMEEAVRNRWYEIARRVGVSEKDCERIRSAFAYKGFRLPMESAQETA